MDPCGTVTESLVDVSTGVELALDASLFTLITSGSTSTFTIATTNFTDAGTYVLRLLV